MPQVKEKKLDPKTIQFLGGVVKASGVEPLLLHADDSGELLKRTAIVFAGRSNVGKSSLINTLTGTMVARVSQSPGKTREMNFFTWRFLGKNLLLCDLPGYGFAKVAQGLKQEWGREITNFLTSEEDPDKLVVSLIDGNLGFMPLDLEFIEFLRKNGVPFLVAFTKMDKWKSRNKQIVAEKKLDALCKQLHIENYCFVSSKEKGKLGSLCDSLKGVLES